MAEDDRPFWSARRGGSSWLPHDPAWRELHDYDFEMRGPYETGRLLDAYLEWREFRDEDRRDVEGRARRPAETPYELLHRWEEWRRERHRRPSEPRRRRAPSRFRERRRGPGRGPEWRRADL